jgi:hypothetical protein
MHVLPVAAFASNVAFVALALRRHGRQRVGAQRGVLIGPWSADGSVGGGDCCGGEAVAVGWIDAGGAGWSDRRPGLVKWRGLRSDPMERGTVAVGGGRRRWCG